MGMWLGIPLKHWGIFLHLVNIFQILRLLATRGHYSIDILVGWLVAVYVSNPAERVGRWYSRASAEEIQTSLRKLGMKRPQSLAQTLFEKAIGANDIRQTSKYQYPQRRPSPLGRSSELASSLDGLGSNLDSHMSTTTSLNAKKSSHARGGSSPHNDSSDGPVLTLDASSSVKLAEVCERDIPPPPLQRAVHATQEKAAAAAEQAIEAAQQARE